MVDVPTSSIGVLSCVIVEMVSKGGGPHVLWEWLTENGVRGVVCFDGGVLNSWLGLMLVVAHVVGSFGCYCSNVVCAAPLVC